MFRVGQKVVLVGWTNDGAVEEWSALGANYPKVGEVYTVRAIKPWCDSAVLLLEEINNSHLGYNPEPGFRQSFFRPVVSRPTSIAVFEEILRTASTRLPSDMATAEPRSADGGVR